MKKRLLSLLAVTALLISLFAACKQTAENQKETNHTTIRPTASDFDASPENGEGAQNAVGDVATTAPLNSGAESRKLTAAEAEDIALADAGLTRETVTRLYTEFDYDDGVPQYEVQFEHERLEYEYEIHAETGSILSRDKDRD